jgi:F-type H+-transporting ATPase subunit epsilon
MILKLLTPTDVLIDQPVEKLIFEAENGSGCLLPRHIDFVTALVPGILIFTSASGEENFWAIDEGILVKCSQIVWVSTLNAIAGQNLETLKKTVEDKFKMFDEQERLARSALAKFEASLIRHFREIVHERI